MRQIDRMIAEGRQAERAPRRRLPAPDRLGCTSYVPGHNAHWIQALHTANDDAAASWRGLQTSIDREVLTVKADDEGRLVQFRHHDPERLAAATHLPTAVLVNDQFAILRVASHCFSVRDAGEALGACPTHSLPGGATDEQLERVQTHGGFSVQVHRRPSAGGP